MPDPAGNPRLRAAIIEARKNNMPRDRIERAIKSALPGAKDGADYLEIRYEGYGPGGCALIVEALTDNRNRTASELRTTFSKHGGTMGESGSVAFMFARVGEILYPSRQPRPMPCSKPSSKRAVRMSNPARRSTRLQPASRISAAVRDALEKKFGEPESAKLAWKPQTLAPVSGKPAAQLIKLIEALEDNDDVQNVTCNFEIDEAELAQLTAA